MGLDVAAPVARRRQKSRPDTTAARERFIAACARAAHGMRRLVPAIWEGRVVAWIGSFDGARAVVVRHEPWMWARRGYLFGVLTEDDMIANVVDSGHYWHEPWTKTLGSGPGSRWAHLWALQGTHCGQWDGIALSNQDRTDQTLGALWHGGDVSPLKKVLASGGNNNSASPSITDATVFKLYDLVRSYDNITTSAVPQTLVNSPGTPTRWCGAGDVGLDVMSVTVGASGNVTWTLSYTDTSGTGGKSPDTLNLQTMFLSSAPTTIDQWPSAFEYNNQASVLELGLAGQDTGVRSVDSVTFGGTGSVVGIILGRTIAWMPAALGGYYSPIDFTKQAGEDLVVVPDKACLTHAKYEVTLGHNNHGGLNFLWG